MTHDQEPFHDEKEFPATLGYPDFPNHTLVEPEVFASKRNDLRIGRMIASFEPKYHLGVGELQVMKQGCFFRAWPQDQYFPA